jgi:acetyltransferase-like isoleucine patch superfamily enzyme
VYVAWEDWARAALTWLESTLLLSWYLRAMGVTLGKGVVLGPGMAQVVDPDMLVIEDGATVCSMFQAHTFEDRVLKIDRIRVGRQAALGSATVPLYGADIGEGAWVEPGSVVMKHEHLLPGVRYAGAPAHESSLEPFK